jgi:hypothetical protein
LFAPRAAEARSNEEMDFHIAMETDRLIREERVSPLKRVVGRSQSSAA